jgi:hypothetical protein
LNLMRVVYAKFYYREDVVVSCVVVCKGPLIQLCRFLASFHSFASACEVCMFDSDVNTMYNSIGKDLGLEAAFST